MKLMTEKQYREVFLKQKKRCAICGKHQTRVWKHFGVDHNHITGQVRGLLCQSCNLGLGAFKDSPAILKKALKYLKGWQKC